MITSNDGTVEKLLSDNKSVVLMFGATWCMPCKMLKPKFKQVSEENEDFVFAYCDVDETSQFAAELDIQSIPTIVSFLNGEEHETVMAPSEGRVRELVEKLRTHANS